MTTFTRASIRCSRPGRRRDVVGEDRAAHQIRRAAQRLVDEPTLAALPDAATRTQADLAPQQPVRREARGVGLRRRASHARADVSCGASADAATSVAALNIKKMTPTISNVPTTAEM